MNVKTRILLSAAVCVLATQSTHAHFLFARILPPAEGGRAVEVYFSELAEAGDPRFIAKMARTSLWLQQKPGEWLPLDLHKLDDRLRAHLPYSGPAMVAGVCEYGVLAREKQTPFLLCHYPKAISGKPEEINALKEFGMVPFEIVATIAGPEMRLTALLDGKPMPKAEFVTVDAQLANTQLIANEKGQAVWKPSPGSY